jgi:stage II sporulation protein R
VLSDKKRYKLVPCKIGLKGLISTGAKWFLLILIALIIYGGITQQSIADKVVRLHIVANSDSETDQNIKLKVRDAVLEQVRKEYPNGAARKEAAQYLKNNLDKIKQTAENVLKENGSNKKADVKYGVFSFPTKTYGNIALPAGMYEAVRVELGEAQGENWWCVMFPPLCVADAHSLKMDEQAMGQLKDELGMLNYSLITDITERKNAPVKIKFRIVELVENSRMKLADLISHLF